TWQVNMQADARFRMDANTVRKRKFRNADGDVVESAPASGVRTKSTPLARVLLVSASHCGIGGGLITSSQGTSQTFRRRTSSGHASRGGDERRHAHLAVDGTGRSPRRRKAPALGL